MGNIQTKSNTGTLLFTICLASSLVPFLGSALNLALPYINNELSLDAITSGWIPTSYMLSTAIFQIPCARIADMIGRKKVFVAGVIVLTIFSLLSGLASTGTTLIIYRFLAGFGSAMMFGTSTAILTSSIPIEKRGQSLGIVAATVYFSLAAGPFLGGLLTQYFNWHSIFFLSAFISLIVAISGYLVIKDDFKEDKPGKFDIVGSILFAIGLSSLIYGFSELPHSHGFILIGIGTIILIYFALYEKKQEYPVFNIRVFLENRIFRMSGLSALINYSATFAISFMLSLYLQYVRGLSPRDAGFILIIQSVVQALVSLKSGKLSDKMPAATLATLGMAILSVGLIGLCFISATTSYLYLAIVLIILGLGFGIFSSPNTNIIMSSVDKKHYGLASATMGTMRLTGQAFSMGIAIMSISLVIGNIQLSPNVHAELITSMRITFAICLMLSLFGVYASSIRNEKKIR
ncbi:MFS transporter [Dysgonomonas sp. Marseille-P4677]|uniref:MFS transporter n=1 Tax=Dysgonomonas sp. Marseille-P4677 TaxID=2364790 RepID=UPI0019143E3D|nr:MFS transporter [Dysgonomonas sp. Marseille-P4677]MBK5720706.1 MFS transporter [Dysgonomonas sp. Marseille-P4677]